MSNSVAESELKRARGPSGRQNLHGARYSGIFAGKNPHSSIHERPQKKNKTTPELEVVFVFPLVTRSRIELLLPP